jgi:hypothetical protein
LDHSAPTILFSGESLMLGYGIDYEDTIPVRVGESLGFQAANLAVSGTANDEIYIRLKDYLPRFERPVAVVTMVVFNILFRNAVDWRFHLELDDAGKLILMPAGEGFFWSSPLYRTSRELYHSAAAPELVRAILRETDQMVKRAGAKPLFVFTQCAWERCLPTATGQQWLREYLREGLGLASVDVDFDPALRQQNDFHPSARAMPPYYAAITDALRRMGVDGSPGRP